MFSRTCERQNTFVMVIQRNCAMHYRTLSNIYAEIDGFDGPKLKIRLSNFFHARITETTSSVMISRKFSRSKVAQPDELVPLQWQRPQALCNCNPRGAFSFPHGRDRNPPRNEIFQKPLTDSAKCTLVNRITTENCEQ
jgi:hypothetical protein